MNNVIRFRNFVQGFTTLVAAAQGDESRIFKEGAPLLAGLVSHDDWLPDAYAKPDAAYYQQYLLHCDPLERFSVIALVWNPGQAPTPVHDHTIWGMVGMLRGAETNRFFSRAADGKSLVPGELRRLEPGEVVLVSPRVGDIHEVANALPDAVSISIHVYGGNIGGVERHVFDTSTGQAKSFVSGYSNTALPNLWDRSEEVRSLSR